MGGFMAIQGLWSVPWLMEVNGLSREEAGHVLFALSTAQLAGYFMIGIGASWLREEWDASGLDFNTRGARVDEALEVVEVHACAG